MDTAIERDFAGGRFTFYLPLSAVLAVEKGPLSPHLRVREYPVSMFQIYDELSAGIAMDADGNLVRLPGARIFAGDLHNILEQALKAGKSGERDGETFEVDGRLANRLVNEQIQASFESCAILAWDVLNATIKGIDLKKKDPAPNEPVARSPSGEGRSSPTVGA